MVASQTMTFYTAKVTEILVSRSVASSISSIADVIAMQKSCCVLEAIKEVVALKQPKLSPLLVGVQNAKQALTFMDAGICQVAVLEEDSFLLSQAGAYATADTEAKAQAVYDAAIAKPLGSFPEGTSKESQLVYEHATSQSTNSPPRPVEKSGPFAGVARIAGTRSRPEIWQRTRPTTATRSWSARSLRRPRTTSLARNGCRGLSAGRY